MEGLQVLFYLKLLDLLPKYQYQTLPLYLMVVPANAF